MAQGDKPLVWMKGEVKTPPFTTEARIEAGVLLRRLQQGEKIGLPQSRPMPVIGPKCHELRIQDESTKWRIFYHLASDAVVILAVAGKDTRATPQQTIKNCQKRLQHYLSIL
jgi:phage-related protein